MRPGGFGGHDGSDDGNVYWEDHGGMLHLVPLGIDCYICGCQAPAHVLQEDLMLAQVGEDFNCTEFTLTREGVGGVVPLASFGGHTPLEAGHHGDLSFLPLSPVLCFFPRSISDMLSSHVSCPEPQVG